MQELIDKLTEIVSAGTKKADLEQSIGLPTNSLSAVLSGTKSMPASWIPKIQAFLAQPLVEAGEITSLPLKERVMSVGRAGKLELKPTKEQVENLQAAMDKINKDFGAGSIMTLGDAPIKGIEVVSTGSMGLDMALGVGGLPKGRIIEIYGPESSGKTTIALHVIAEAQKKGGICAFIDAEHSFDAKYAKAIGVDIPKLRLSQPEYGEMALQEADMIIGSGGVSVVVIDSVAALIPKGELEGEMGDSKMGLQARLMSQACRKLTGTIAKTGTICIFINQLRSTIGNMYVFETTTGGKALQFYASVRLDVRRRAQIKDGEEIMGNKTEVKVVKNKVAPPFKKVEFDIMYGEGIDRMGEIIDVAVTQNIIKKAGSWFSYNETNLGQGRETIRQLLKDNPEMCQKIEAQLTFE